MSKQSQVILDKKMSKVSKNTKTSENIWDSAISEAEKQIENAQNRVKDLKKAIVTFKELRDRGERFASSSSP